jgi:drug/metabolite transporter (DMT)-like permease
MHERCIAASAARTPSRQGLLCAFGAILIWSFWPAWTRHGVTGHLSADDIVFLRFGIGGLLFLPFLLVQAKSLRPRAWVIGLGLAICQGAPFVMLVATGLRFAPANHAAALTTGLSPLFAAVLGAALFHEPVTKRRAAGLGLILLGVGALAYSGSGPAVLGDALFVAAAAIVSIYLVGVSRSGLSGFEAAAMVSVLSMIAYLPVYLLFGDQRIASAPWSEVVQQGLYQGVLMAFVSFLLLNAGITRLGASRASAMIALVPALTLLLAIPLLGEWPTQVEGLSAILVSLGVYFASQWGASANPRPNAA